MVHYLTFLFLFFAMFYFSKLYEIEEIRKDHSKPDSKNLFLILLGDKCDKRILGDRLALRSEWLFVVLLINMDESRICSGSLVRQNWVLTSAYCVIQRKRSGKKIYVIYNIHDLKQPDMNCTYGVPFTHPRYKITGGIAENDIALVRLDYKMNIPEYTLARISNHRVDTSCACCRCSKFKVASWGIYNVNYLSTSGNLEVYFNSKRFLYEVDQDMVNPDQCKSVLGLKDVDGIICTTVIKSRRKSIKGPLIGEAGGPLVTNGEQVGIVSGAGYRNMLENNNFAVWTNVSNYAHWINETITLQEPQEVEKAEEWTFYAYIPILDISKNLVYEASLDSLPNKGDNSEVIFKPVNYHQESYESIKPERTIEKAPNHKPMDSNAMQIEFVFDNETFNQLHDDVFQCSECPRRFCDNEYPCSAKCLKDNEKYILDKVFKICPCQLEAKKYSHMRSEDEDTEEESTYLFHY